MRSDAEVEQLLVVAQAAGATITKPAATNPLGFRSGVFLDPDGYPWEIAHNPGFPLAADGSITIPDFGA